MKKVFSKPSEAELKKKLTSLQYQVTQEEETESPFKNEFWDNKSEGIYVDIVSGEALFSSLDKFDSGTGWPSFTKPISENSLTLKTDRRFIFMTRTEVRSKLADSHLGHVFDDGPAPSHKRYCMNSAAMRFIPKNELVAEGFGEFKSLFDNPETEIATLAGGCFWGMEDLIRMFPGVIKTEVGYTGGQTTNPRYEEVKTGTTGHAESIEIHFDPKKTTYEKVLKFFFRIHDPTTKNSQGNDRGSQYRSAIFYHSEEQKKTAEKVKAFVDASGKWPSKAVTEIVPASTFTIAEDYHQDYLEEHPQGYTCHFIRPFDFEE